MPPRLAAMIKDLKAMKKEINNEKDEKNDPTVAGLDVYGRAMLKLTKLLAEIRVEVDRLNELRAAAPDGRDIHTIRIGNDNLKLLKQATDLWKEAKAESMRAHYNKLIDDKEMEDRKAKLVNLFDEIKSLSTKNANVQMERTAVERDIDEKKAERERRKAALAARRAARQGHHKDGSNDSTGDDDKTAAGPVDAKTGSAGSGGSAAAGGGLDDIALVDMRPLDQQQQDFIVRARAAMDDQDALLDQLLSAVNDLLALAKDIGVQIRIGSALATDLGTRMDKTIDTLKSSNQRLQEILDDAGGASRWIPTCICLIVLLACAGFLYSSYH